MQVVVVLGNQLFDPRYLKNHKVDPKTTVFFMREDRELATYYKFHKHKIIFFFASMRAYREELVAQGYKVHYEELNDNRLSFEESLRKFVKSSKIQTASTFEIEDKFFETRIVDLFQQLGLELEIWQSPMFLTTRAGFHEYLKSSRRPFMKTFYEAQRKRLDILMDGTKPVGGAWSFDTENRQALPKGMTTPNLPEVKITDTISNVSKLVAEEFADHPGEVEDFWLPVDRDGARKWLKAFLKDRLAQFGPFEDAIPPHSEFVFHSVLTPFLNSGILTPRAIVQETLAYSQKNAIPLASLEGFIRQIIGWREFIRGIYQNFSDKQETSNFWEHDKKLSPLWYSGNTGIPPLDMTIERARRRGYAHHIERLMIVGNLMLLLEVEPREAHRWFMEMFIDSSDWVMGPNVYGMALFSDGGLFATKPYICGSNYMRKMGGFPNGPWCDGVDGLYWQFIRKHEKFFLKNPRLSMMARASQKIAPDRLKTLEAAAHTLRGKLVCDR